MLACNSYTASEPAATNVWETPALPAELSRLRAIRIRTGDLVVPQPFAAGLHRTGDNSRRERRIRTGHTMYSRQHSPVVPMEPTRITSRDATLS